MTNVVHNVLVKSTPDPDGRVWAVLSFQQGWVASAKGQGPDLPPESDADRDAWECGYAMEKARYSAVIEDFKRGFEHGLQNDVSPAKTGGAYGQGYEIARQRISTAPRGTVNEAP